MPLLKIGLIYYTRKISFFLAAGWYNIFKVIKIASFYENRAQALNPQNSEKCWEDDRWLKVSNFVKGTGLKILDVGCGNGWQTQFFLENNDVYGVDISEANIKQANSRGIKAQVLDLEKPLPFADEYFDVVVCSEVLEHLFFPAEVIAEIKRVLKTGGKLILSVPNLYCLGNRLAMLYGKKTTLIEYPFNEEHIRHYSISGLKKILRSLGFRLESAAGASFVMNLMDLNIFSFFIIGVPYLILGLPFVLYSLLRHLVKLDLNPKKIVLSANFNFMNLLGKMLPAFSPGIVMKFSKKTLDKLFQ